MMSIDIAQPENQCMCTNKIKFDGHPDIAKQPTFKELSNELSQTFIHYKTFKSIDEILNHYGLYR